MGQDLILISDFKLLWANFLSTVVQADFKLILLYPQVRFLTEMYIELNNWIRNNGFPLFIVIHLRTSSGQIIRTNIHWQIKANLCVNPGAHGQLVDENLRGLREQHRSLSRYHLDRDALVFMGSLWIRSEIDLIRSKPFRKKI